MANPDSTNHEWYSDGLRFTCTQCGNCCTGPPGYVWFDDGELSLMADHLKISEDEFLRRYAHEVEGDWSLNERKTEQGYDCVFLARDAQGRGRCSIYAVRPVQCRTWPFWPDNLRNAKTWAAAARRCPGVAASLEGRGDLYPLDQIRLRREATP